MPPTGRAVAEDLGRFIDDSPSPYHAVASAAQRLADAGFSALSETEPWQPQTGGRFVARGGALVAWVAGQAHGPTDGFRIIGAHTDSPNLRIKPRPASPAAGFAQLGVEVYGGVLLNSWLDRDLGISGRVVVREERGPLRTRLLRIDEPLARVPQLAIHLDRQVNDKGLVLNRQRHLSPVWSLDPKASFARWLAERTDCHEEAIAGYDLMLHDLTPSTLLGRDREMLAAPRIDNQASCHAGVLALLDAAQTPGPAVPVLCLFDHEEVGSTSTGGATGSLLPTVLERIHGSLGGDRASWLVALAHSSCISADGAHATHPNYPDRHEPDHRIALNKGPVIKRNANERYATDAMGQAIAETACRAAGVPTQLFVNRSDLACGSTIGPITAAQLGITTVDLGLAQLSMHSARELCGADDPAMLAAALSAFARA